MGESSAHVYLVEVLIKWISENLLNGNKSYIISDGALSSGTNTPPAIYGYVPDIYVPKGPEELFVVGEAKTSRDLDNEHTYEQIKAFLKKCSENRNSLFIMAVPWDMVRLAHSILRVLKKESNFENVSAKIISEFNIL